MSKRVSHHQVAVGAPDNRLSPVSKWGRGPGARWSGARWLGIVVVVLGLVLLAGSFVVARDLAGTARQLRGEAGRNESLVLSNVRTLSQTQRELLRLLHLLDIGAPPGKVRQQVGFVAQRIQESALPQQAITLGSQELAAVAVENERVWRDEVLPAVRTAIRAQASAGRVAGPVGQVKVQADSATASSTASSSTSRSSTTPSSMASVERARAAISSLELSYNTLAAVGEVNRREQTSLTKRTASQMAGDLDGLLVALGVLLAAGVVLLAVGSAVVARSERRRRQALSRLRVVNDDLGFYARIVEATDSPLVATDTTGRITWVNGAFERRTGWSLAVAAGRLSSEFMMGPATDPAAVEELRRVLREGRPVTAEVASYGTDGEEIWWTVDVAPLADKSGAREGYFAVLTDVTTRRAAEALLEKARRDAEISAQQKTAVLATMSHEIRTPMNAVVGLNELLLHTELDEEQREYVDTARRSGEHLLRLINDILDYYSLEAGQMPYVNDPIDIGQVLNETVEMFANSARTKNVALTHHLDQALTGVELGGDETRLRQILVNLIGNALKFTDHGSVTITSTWIPATPADAPPADASSIQPGRLERGELVVVIEDTGIGIPQWRIPELFESYVRGNGAGAPEHPGTGLGLALSKGLVERMGGSVELDSTLDVGTTLTIRTPHDVLARTGRRSIGGGSADYGAANGSASGSGNGSGGASSLRLMVVEDDPINRKVVTGMLARLGVTPTVVFDGQQALEAATTTHFDVILMDVEMPVMNGVTAARKIRDLYPHTTSGDTRPPHIVALTANALAGDRDRFLGAGMDGYLSKPITLQALADTLNDIEHQPTLTPSLVEGTTAS